ncbi:MAG: DUF808 family protein [Bacteroidota bacterium]
MASGFFALLDDIAVLMDDVLTMSKVTTKKTAGILGDDLAVNAEKASGFVSSREIPVLWAITKGSFLNKLIILPISFLLSAFLPSVLKIVLVLGGLYLAYEGVEKIYEFFFHTKDKVKSENSSPEDSPVDLEDEKAKIRSAIITDFILSVEIVIIAISTVIDRDLTFQIIVVSIVAIIATIGVYGIVALIVRIDDLGLRLVKANPNKTILNKIGKLLILALPKIVRALSVIGTIALLLVAGGIFVHNIEYLHHFLENWPGILRDFTIGFIFGLAALIIVNPIKSLFKKRNN